MPSSLLLFSFSSAKATFNNTGVIIVVITTHITNGGSNEFVINPTAIPLLATIKATSPLDTIPEPICNDSLLVYLHNLAPIPQPTTLVSIATIVITIVNNQSDPLIELNETFKPILAKKTGDKSMYDNVSNLSLIYSVFAVLDTIRPAIKAPVISATPKNSSATYAKTKQITKAAKT